MSVKYLFKKNDELTYVKNSAVQNNCFLSKEAELIQLPRFEESRTLLPQPIWDGRSDVLDCYWRAWEIAFSNLRNPCPESGFVSPFIDTAFNGFLFMWDSSFITMFGRYGTKAFDFQKTLDNFYASQHKDGFICRELCEMEEGGHFSRHDPSSTGPAIMAWSEWEYYLTTADKCRLKSIFDPLFAYHRWMRLNRTWRDGTYWSTGFGCGMDNQPRLQEGYDVFFSHGHQIWVDACLQAVLDAKILCLMAKELDRSDVLDELGAEIERLTEQINQLLWSDEDAFYYDLWKNSEQNKVKSIGAYWALLADTVPNGKMKSFIAHLEDKNEFNTPHPIPSLSADHSEYDPGGGYWRGGVWAPTNYMVLKGLEKIGEEDLAHRIACKHLNAVVEVFRNTGTIWENYSPEQNTQGNIAKKEFVGWTGLVPISVLFEYVFGIRGDPIHKKIRWNVNCLERHGVMNYPFGSGSVDLICEARQTETERPKIQVKTDIPLTLEILWNETVTSIDIPVNGEFRYVCP